MSSKGAIKIPISGTLAADVDDTDAHEVIAAQAGFSIKLTAIGVTNSDASNPTVVKLLSGTDLKLRLNAPVGGGFMIPQLSEDSPLVGNLGEAWNIQCENAGSTTQVFLHGYLYRTEAP